MERWGRSPNLTGFLAASGAFTLLFALARGTWAIVLAAALMSFCALGAWAALYAYTSETYATAVRATGTGWAAAMARIAAVLVTLLGAAVVVRSLGLALAFCAGAFLAGAVVVAVLGRETRGRPLADGLDPPGQSALAVPRGTSGTEPD